MAKKNWSYQEIQGLIAAVRKNASLYDRRHPDYNLNRAKEDIWTAISKLSSIADKNPEECKKKWKHLRIQQRRILMNKVRNHKANIQWNCYDALKFLIPHMDWSPADEVKREPDLDMSFVSNDYEGDGDDPDDCNNDDNYDTQSDGSVSSSPFEPSSNEGSIAATQADSTNATRLLITPNNLYGAALAAENANRLQHYPIGNADTGTPQSPKRPTISPTDGSRHSMGNQLQVNRMLTIPMSAPSTMNYFLMDVAMQMERLNDIAQMELKIDIHRLLLDKLRNHRNLR